MLRLRLRRRVPPATQVASHRHWRARATAGVLAAAGGVVLLFLAPVRINYSSPSAPRGVYRLTAGPIERGSWVVVCLPPAIAALGRRRAYLPAGLTPARCLDGSSEVLKRVGAVAGDVVALRRDGVAVNGHLLPGTPLLARDRAGRPLPPPGSTYRLARGEVFLLSTFIPNSWDSRYYGPIDESWVRAKAEPLLVFP